MKCFSRNSYPCEPQNMIVMSFKLLYVINPFKRKMKPDLNE